MKALIISIAGGVTLSLIADIILPDGEIRKVAKFAIGIIISMIILNPITNFIMEIKGKSFDYTEFEVSKAYIESVERDKAAVYERAVEFYLSEEDIESKVSVYMTQKEISFVIVKTEYKDIDKVTEIVATILKINKGLVTCYG